MPILLHCHKGIGPAVSGRALVAADHFSARYDLDRGKGIFSPSGVNNWLRSAACKLAISSAAEIPFPEMSAIANATRLSLNWMKS